MLRTAGPHGMLLSFIFFTVLAWGVVQFITDIISIWPVRGALVDFVRYFVDEDLALTVGAAYWFTYSINFAAHMTAVAGEVAVWQVPRWIDRSILFFLVPLVLICINNLGVRLYGFVGLVGGITKLVLTAAVIIICMSLINNRGASDAEGELHKQFWRGTTTSYDTGTAQH
ncbi:hypothetical protein ABVK25_006501 [Lepraria finkii]|uniref:Amino acid permease/ SLC12A domain-containing protein n=1 Tax=Lepraria finkii TaxID=1340010 RepID=A0ABR4B8H7_9LECA